MECYSPSKVYDLLEKGLAGHELPRQYLRPIKTTKLINNYIVLSKDKQICKLYEDYTDKFLLFAKKSNDGAVWNIYAYDENAQAYNKDRPFCVMNRLSDGSRYVLWNTSCEGCDSKYFFTCLPRKEHTKECSLRQQLLFLEHFTEEDEEEEGYFTSMRMVIPAIDEELMERKIWCPRKITPPTSKPSRDHFLVSFASAAQEDKSNYVALETKDPDYDEDNDQYKMDFGGRVKLSSSRNFQLMREEDETERTIFQFGKASSKKYVLDFMYPLCVVQALAIALTSFDI